MLLSSLLIFWILGAMEETSNFKYALSIPIVYPFHGGVNFELRVKNNFSLSFELNNYLFIIPWKLELGIREYLGKDGFDGIYFYQGLGMQFFYFFYDEGTRKIIPNLTFSGGYKFVFDSGFTLSPFLGIFVPIINFSTYSPVIGLYIGYSW